MHCHTKRLLKYHNYILLSVYILIYFVRYNISLYIGGDYLLPMFSSGMPVSGPFVFRNSSTSGMERKSL
jgi:hypothetical protein